MESYSGKLDPGCSVHKQSQKSFGLGSEKYEVLGPLPTAKVRFRSEHFLFWTPNLFQCLDHRHHISKLQNIIAL